MARRDALKFSFICGMGISDNLGTYLGFPLFMGEPKKSILKRRLKKLKKKLSGWKTGNLVCFHLPLEVLLFNPCLLLFLTISCKPLNFLLTFAKKLTS